MPDQTHQGQGWWYFKGGVMSATGSGKWEQTLIPLRKPHGGRYLLLGTENGRVVAIGYFLTFRGESWGIMIKLLNNKFGEALIFKSNLRPKQLSPGLQSLSVKESHSNKKCRDCKQFSDFERSCEHCCYRRIVQASARSTLADLFTLRSSTNEIESWIEPDRTRFYEMLTRLLAPGYKLGTNGDRLYAYVIQSWRSSPDGGN